MSGLREAFDEILTDVPVYGDLDRAVEQANRRRRHRHGVVAGLAAAAAVVAVIVGVLAARDVNNSQQPIGPATPTPSTPTASTPSDSQSAQTWSDTVVAAEQGYGWAVPNPLQTAQAGWFPVVAEHLDPAVGDLDPEDFYPGREFSWPSDGSPYSYSGYGHIELLTDRGPFEDGCGYLGTPPATNGTESCSTERVTGPNGEPARISRYQRRCGAFDGLAAQYATCGDYRVAVAVERRDDLIGYLVVNGRGTTDYNPFDPDAMVAAAADARLTLPEAALAVPSDQVAASVLSDHFPSWQADPEASPPPDHPGYANVAGTLGRNGLGLSVHPAGGNPVCGRSWLVECVERRVFGADDPTTVFVGAWDEDDWASCCPRNSRRFSRQFVYVGPRNTVVVGLTRIVREHEDGIGTGLDRRVIDLLLDSRLQ